MQPVVRSYNHQTFRPEAVEAHATRQAGEPWQRKQRLEGLLIAVLTLFAAGGLICILMGGH
jgi:hypothetical protein